MYLLFCVFSETRTSYKGFASWLMLANSTHCYLYDCIALKNNIKRTITRLLADKRIIKLSLDNGQSIDDMKRDYQAFTNGYFNMECVERFQPEIAAERYAY